MQQGDNRIGVLKVFKTKSSNYKPNSHNLPIILMVRFKKGANPQYTSYKLMRQQFPEILLDYFQKKIILRDAESGSKHLQHNQYEHFPGSVEQLREIQKQSPIKESRILRTMKAKKAAAKSPKKETSVKQISLSVDSRPLRSCRFRHQLPGKRELRGLQLEKEPHQVSQSPQESDQSIVQNVNQQTQSQFKKILDYDHLIEESACLNLISPAVIPPIKPKHEFVIQPPTAYQMPPRINFKEPEHQQYSSQVFKDSDESEFLLDERGKQKRRKQKLLREQQKMNKRKKLKKFKKKQKGKVKNK